MIDVNVKIIGELKRFVSLVANTPDLLDKFRRSSTDFTRKRKLSFQSLVLLIAKLCKKTLSMELESFFEQSGAANCCCSVSAFCQQRLKLKPLFFYYWNIVLWTSYYRYAQQAVKRWKGYRIVAADGSTVSLVDTPALSSYFGGQSNQKSAFVLAKTFYYYDVFNELILSAHIKPYRYAELNLAYELVDKLQEDMLMVYDRNFCNYKMVALHQWQEKEIKFIIRAKENLQVVRSFMQSGKLSEVVELQPGSKAIEGLKKSGYRINKKTLLKVRLVRVELEKTTEVLLTNLWEEEGHGSEEFKALYGLRWGVETNISLQKNVLTLESFSGLTPLAVVQDFYATVFMTNLHAVVLKDAQQSAEQQHAGRKYPVKINNNKAVAKLKTFLVALFLSYRPKKILQILHDCYIKEVLPVREGRSFERVRKNHSRNKHRTYTNYKPAY
jgi:hypothetical protein